MLTLIALLTLYAVSCLAFGLAVVITDSEDNGE